MASWIAQNRAVQAGVRQKIAATVQSGASKDELERALVDGENHASSITERSAYLGLHAALKEQGEDAFREKVRSLRTIDIE